MAHNFKMDAPFLQGIRYLSWQEEAQARTTATAEWSRETIADISISRDDTENLQLMARVREEISIWRQRTSVRFPGFSLLFVQPYTSEPISI